MKIKVLLLSILLVGGLAMMVRTPPVVAQGGTVKRPVDLMIVVDNSCSMFPQEMIVAGCTSYGSDVNFLRIKGSDLFLARLGFDQENEDQYHVGIISLGEESRVLSPLVELSGNRDYLSGRLANPRPERATRFVPALQRAYLELRNSTNRIPENLPAVVLITDGVPYPTEGQSNAEIEKLIADNADIPIFLMILKGVDSNVEEFDEYVRFWNEVKRRYNHVYVDLIENDTQIENSFNEIVALLQDTIPTQPQTIVPGEDLKFYVDQYVKKVVLTFSYPPNVPVGSSEVIDPNGEIVEDEEEGVSHFLGRQNPVEVLSISAPRLAEELKDQFWTVRSSWVSTVFIDREGAYKIEFISPDTTPTDINNVYLVSERQTPREAFDVAFRLVSDEGEVVLEPQPIRYEILFPNAPEATIIQPIIADIDDEGVYRVEFDLPTIYPYVGSEFERFVFIIHAGSAGGEADDELPIATSRMLVDIGPKPYVQLISPSRVICSPGRSSRLLVTIGDYQQIVTDTLKITVSSQEGSLDLGGEAGEFRGDLSDLCDPLYAELACGETGQAAFVLNVQAQLEGDQPQELVEKELEVSIESVLCTATPVPTTAAIVLPTPKPTSIPDSDQDGFNDLVDGCPEQKGWQIFEGCLPSKGTLLGIIGILLIVIVLFVIFVWPWLAVRTVSKPPEVYVLVCRKDAPKPELVSISELGVSARSSRIKIGSDERKAHLVISGLRSIEFVIGEKEDKPTLMDFRGEPIVTIRQLTPEKVSTSNPEVKLWMASKRSALEKIEC